MTGVQTCALPICLGFVGSAIAFLFSFIPPAQIKVGSPVVYVGILVVLMIVFCAIPFIVYANRKEHWKDPNTDFAPFTWQIEGTHPGIVNHSEKETDELVHHHFAKLEAEAKKIEKEIVDEVHKIEKEVKEKL